MQREQPVAASIADRLRLEAHFFDQLKAQADWKPARFYQWNLYGEALDASRAQLGELQGKVVLEFGCGLGLDTVFLARQGARVFSFDVSQEMVRGVASLAKENSVSAAVSLSRMAGDTLAVRDKSVDLIYGRSVLHHLDLMKARDEIRRVLREGGKAVFLEPLGHNPVLNLFRRLTPSRRTPTEKPLTRKDLDTLASAFDVVHVTGWCLTSLLALVFCYFPRNQKLFQHAVRVFGVLDRRLLLWFPGLKYFCWIGVIVLETRDSSAGDTPTPSKDCA